MQVDSEGLVVAVDSTVGGTMTWKHLTETMMTRDLGDPGWWINRLDPVQIGTLNGHSARPDV